MKRKCLIRENFNYFSILYRFYYDSMYTIMGQWILMSVHDVINVKQCQFF